MKDTEKGTDMETPELIHENLQYIHQHHVSTQIHEIDDNQSMGDQLADEGIL